MDFSTYYRVLTTQPQTTLLYDRPESVAIDGWFMREACYVGTLDYSGANGAPGRNGRGGVDGSGGHPGENGENGEHGSPGRNGAVVHLHLRSKVPGDYSTLIVDDLARNESREFHLPPSSVKEQFVLITARGGQGGPGGRGGPGGAYGGHGGSAGSGGAGGHGGFVKVTASDSALLTLVKVDVAGGQPGQAGAVGSGAGPQSALGRPGPRGRDGGREFITIDPQTTAPKERSILGPNLALTALSLHDQHADAVVEPGELLKINALTVRNVGGITAPAGTVLRVAPLSGLALTEDHVAVLPELAPGAEYVLPQVYGLQVSPAPQVTGPGAYQSRAVWAVSTQFMNRQYQHASVAMSAHVCWPLQLRAVHGPRELGAEDEGELAVQVHNCSSRVYGLEGTRCSLLFTTDARMPPNMVKLGSSRTAAQPNPITWELNIDNLQPGETREFKVRAKMNSLNDSAVKYFDRVTWRVDLKLRGQVIETANAQIRICPKWEDFARTPSEAILFTGNHVSREEWLAWKRILDGLSLTAALWDVDYYNGISFDRATRERHRESWTNFPRDQPHRRCLIIPPLSPEVYDTLSFEHVLAHLATFPFSTEAEVVAHDEDWGVVIIGPDSELVRAQLLRVCPEVPLPDKYEFAGFPVGKADEKDAMSKAKELVKKMQSKEPEFLVELGKVELKIERGKATKWHYGSMTVKRCPVRRTVKLISVPGYQYCRPAHGLQGSPLSLTTFPRDSGVAQLLLAITAALPLGRRLALLEGPHGLALQEKWSIDQGPVTFEDFVLLSMYRDLKSDYRHEERSFPHLKALLKHVAQHRDEYKSPTVKVVLSYCANRIASQASATDKMAKQFKKEIKSLVFGGASGKASDDKQATEQAEQLVKKHKKEEASVSSLLLPSVRWSLEKVNSDQEKAQKQLDKEAKKAQKAAEKALKKKK